MLQGQAKVSGVKQQVGLAENLTDSLLVMKRAMEEDARVSGSLRLQRAACRTVTDDVKAPCRSTEPLQRLQGQIQSLGRNQSTDKRQFKFFPSAGVRDFLSALSGGGKQLCNIQAVRCHMDREPWQFQGQLPGTFFRVQQHAVTPPAEHPLQGTVYSIAGMRPVLV